jgi:hypothetical protein
MATPISRRFWTPTEFLSETARKERRSLLATASVAILVAWLELDQTEIELAGFKFHHAHLPALIGLSLLATVIYMLGKFCFSFWHGKFTSQMEAYAAQIRQGKTEIDINRVEKEIIEASQNLIEQQKVFQAQQENEKRKLTQLQQTIGEGDDSNEAALKALDVQIGELEAALKEPRGKDYIPIPSMNATVDPDPEKIKGLIDEREKRKAQVITDRHSAREREFLTLRDEERRSEVNDKGRQAKTASDEENIDVKTEAVLRWRHANRGATRVTALHLFLEVGLPVMIGALAIVFLLWYLTHPPAPSKPLSLPDF